MNNKYLPGTTYKTRAKHPQVCQVTDVLKTYDLAGNLVRIRYTSVHEFCGQMVSDDDVCETTISIGLINPVLST